MDIFGVFIFLSFRFFPFFFSSCRFLQFTSIVLVFLNFPFFFSLLIYFLYLWISLGLCLPFISFSFSFFLIPVAFPLFESIIVVFLDFSFFFSFSFISFLLLYLRIFLGLPYPFPFSPQACFFFLLNSLIFLDQVFRSCHYHLSLDFSRFLMITFNLPYFLSSFCNFLSPYGYYWSPLVILPLHCPAY